MTSKKKRGIIDSVQTWNGKLPFFSTHDLLKNNSEVRNMKAEIHPKYHEVTVTCACGATFKTGTTKEGDVMKVDICSNCHPFFTGKQKLVDTGGRIDKFKKRYGL